MVEFYLSPIWTKTMPNGATQTQPALVMDYETKYMTIDKGDGVVEEVPYTVKKFAPRGGNVRFVYDNDETPTVAFARVETPDEETEVPVLKGGMTQTQLSNQALSKSEVVQKVDDWTQFALDHPEFVGKFDDQPVGE